MKQPAIRPEFHPLSIARMLWKRKVTVAATTVVLSAVAAAIVWRLPPIYSSEALVLVDSQKIPEKFVSSTVSADLQDRLSTISQQIMSSTRLKRIIDDFDLYREDRSKLVQEEILEKMRKDITLKVERGWASNKPGAFRIGYQGPDPEIVAQVANRLVNLYVEENLKTREVQAEGTSEFIQTQLQEAKQNLDQLESRVSEYKTQHNGELPQQEQALGGALGRMQSQVQACRDALARAENGRMMLQNMLATAEPTLALMERALEPPQAAPAPSKPVPTTLASADGSPGGGPHAEKDEKESPSIEALQTQLEIVRLRYSDDHPDVRRLKRVIEGAKVVEDKRAKKQERAAAAAVAGSPEGTLRVDPAAPPRLRQQQAELLQARERVNGLRMQLTLTEKEIQSRKAEERSLSGQISSIQSRLDRLPLREQEMAALTRDYEISKANYKSLLDKKLAAEMSTDMERRQKSERFTVIDPARVPEKPIKPNRAAFAGLGVGLSFGLALVAGLGMELRRNTILGEWELPPDIAVLGRVPRIAPGAGRPSVAQRKRLVAAVSVAMVTVAVAAGAFWYWRGM